ncbi:MAG: FAD-dependent monooxygenase [Rhodobacteraceae bacterium]|nr:FAD-dependent monooxygenase [Paracoccaceae bacterium]
MANSSHSCDVFISGGGASGLVMAIALAAKNHEVVCCTGRIAPVPPDWEDNRVTALLPSTTAYFKTLGLWDRLAPNALPLRGAMIAEMGRADTLESPHADFMAEDFGFGDFGSIVQHKALLACLRDHVNDLTNVRIITDTDTSGLVTRSGSARVRLANADQYETRLVIGADGRNSTIRRLCAIGVSVRMSDQAALTFIVDHSHAHRGKTTEIHCREGPFTMIPMPGYSDRTSSVVWMATGQSIRRLREMDRAALNAAATARSSGVLGDLTVNSSLTAWPIMTQTAKRCQSERVVLIAEAAHVMPPIGAQGFNTSVGDIAALMRCLENADDPGAAEILNAYVRQRALPVLMRLQGVELLNRLSIARTPITRALRQGALRTVGKSRPLQGLLVAAMGGHA